VRACPRSSSWLEGGERSLSRWTSNHIITIINDIVLAYDNDILIPRRKAGTPCNGDALPSRFVCSFVWSSYAWNAYWWQWAGAYRVDHSNRADYFVVYVSPILFKANSSPTNQWNIDTIDKILTWSLELKT